MTLMVAGVAFLTVLTVWHLSLAVRSVRRGATSAPGTGRGPDAPSAAPYVLWLVLIKPTPAALTATRAIRLRPRCRTRVVVLLEDLANHTLPEHPDAHVLTVPMGTDRAGMLNHAYRFIRTRSIRDGEHACRAVVGVIDQGVVPDENLAVAVWRAFADPTVGAVQARRYVLGGAAVAAVQQYEDGVLADARDLLRGRRGVAPLRDNGAFVRLSELRRLGSRPWRAGAMEGYDLGLRLRRLGTAIHHDPRLSVAVPGYALTARLRQRTRALQGHLQAWPSRSDQPLPGERWTWLWRLLVAPLPGLSVAAVLTWFGASAYHLAAGAGNHPWWFAISWDQLSWDSPSWATLGRAATIWLAAIVVPAVIWWCARRDQAARVLWRGALARPVLALLTPFTLLIAAVRQLIGRRTWAGVPRGAAVAEAVRALTESTMERPVFVDRTGRRRRRMWTIAYSAAGAGLAYTLVFAYVLVSHPIEPVGLSPHAYPQVIAQPDVAVMPSAQPSAPDSDQDVADRPAGTSTQPAGPSQSTGTAPSTEPTGDPTTEPTGDPTTEPTGDPTTEDPTTDPSTDPTTPQPSTEPTQPVEPSEPVAPDESSQAQPSMSGEA